MYRCSFPGCPLPVSIQISLVETLQAIARTQDGDRQGLLYGQTAPAGTIIESSHAVAGLGVEDLRRAMAASHGTVVGYYRIRNGATLELTPEEMNVAVSLFGKPGSVVLLIERRAGNPAANFFFAEQGAFLNVPLLEFPLDAAALSEEETQRARRLNAKAIAQAAGVPVPGARAVLPAGAQTPEPRRTVRPWALLWMVGMILLAAAASFSAALLIYRPPAKSGNERVGTGSVPQAGSPLRAERQGDDLKILWDLHSPAVVEATSGVLDIEDGGKSRRILMTADQVRYGSVLYTPEADQISVRLTTLKDDRSTEQESVLVLLNRLSGTQQAKGAEKPRVAFEVKTQPLPAAPSASPAAAGADRSPIVFRHFAPLPPPAAQTDTHVELSAAPAVGSMPVASPGGSFPGDLLKPVLPPVPPIAEAPASPAQRSPATAVVSGSTAQRTPPPAVTSGSTAPAGSSGTSAPGKPPATPDVVYVSPTLIAQEGVQMPPQLRTILRRPVTVKVRVEVNEAGKVTKADAIPDRNVHSLLLSAAQDAALRCRFHPARRGQTAVASSVTLVFHVDPDK